MYFDRWPNLFCCPIFLWERRVLIYWLISYLKTLLQFSRLYSNELHGKDFEEDGHDLFGGIIPALAWRGWGKPRKPSPL